MGVYARVYLKSAVAVGTSTFGRWTISTVMGVIFSHGTTVSHSSKKSLRLITYHAVHEMDLVDHTSQTRNVQNVRSGLRRRTATCPFCFPTSMPTPMARLVGMQITSAWLPILSIPGRLTLNSLCRTISTGILPANTGDAGLRVNYNPMYNSMCIVGQGNCTRSLSGHVGSDTIEFKMIIHTSVCIALVADYQVELIFAGYRL
jgi:hypothetical protein